MKKFLILTITVLLAGANSALGSHLSSQIKDKQSQLDQVDTKIKSARQKIDEAKKQEVSITRQISESDLQIAKIQSQIESIQVELDQVTGKRKETEKELSFVAAELEDTIDDLNRAIKQVNRDRKILNQRVLNSYINGKVTYLEVLLNATSFFDLLTRASFLQFIIEQDYQVLERMERTKRTIEQKKQQVEKKKQQIENLKANLVAQETRIASVKQAQETKKREENSEKLNKQKLLEQVEKNKEYYIAVEKQLEKESQEIEGMIRDLMAKNGASFQPVIRGSGKFILPVNGRFSSEFGYRVHPVYGYRKFHAGLDIAAPNGTPIRAAAAGRVLFAGNKGGYGKTVILDHGGGLMTLYAHCSAIYVSEGQAVNTGARIAAVGSTGLSTGNHLHFEVRVNGTPKNPRNYL